MQSVLGLSVTSTSVGWVLLDGQGPDAAVLDYDAFDMQSGVNGAEADKSPHAAAARGAKTIATASGHKVGSVQVTWTEDVEAGSADLLKSLADLGFDNVQSVKLTRAAQTWGIETGRESEHAKTGLCILEPTGATIMIIATGAGSVRTAVTNGRESADDLVEWLRTVFCKDGWLPESLYLMGAQADLDEVTQPLADALPIPVSDSVDTQLALARGAALATADQVSSAAVAAAEPEPEKSWRVPRPKKQVVAAEAETVRVATVGTVDTTATQVIATPRIDPAKRDRPWVLAHAKKLTIGAAAVAVFGAALSLAAGSALNVETASTQAAETADTVDSGASVTSVSVHAVPAPASAAPVPQLQPLAAEPPPETLSLPAEPAAVVAPEPVAVPAPHLTVSTPPPAPVPVVAPVAQPLVVAPLAALVAPPAAAPVAPPAAALAVVAPPPAAPAPVVPPPAAPAPAAPPPPSDAAEPPPPDPIQQVLSPLFSGLP